MKIKPSQYAKKNKITYRTAWNHYKKGWIKCEKTPSGSIFVVDDNQQKNQKAVPDAFANGIEGVVVHPLRITPYKINCGKIS